ncbi:hypothetical protein AB1K70_21300 [Bremerella sp. JC770]|uniref:hypothetical protein n=1 Tax=Bremerella sp. JC770 TaxID=3232137 RepID=UPI00345A9D85
MANSLRMNLIPLNCRNCGAPLQVPADLKHVTCMHCGTQLAIVHEGGAAYTERLEALSERTEQIEDRLAQLHREQKIAALDRAWDKEEDEFKIRRKNGSTELPSKAGSIIAGVTGVGVGLFIIMMGFGAPGGSEMSGVAAVIGLIAMLIGGATATWQYHRAESYEKAKRRYKQRRRDIHDG